MAIIANLKNGHAGLFTKQNLVSFLILEMGLMLIVLVELYNYIHILFSPK